MHFQIIVETLKKEETGYEEFKYHVFSEHV